LTEKLFREICTVSSVLMQFVHFGSSTNHKLDVVKEAKVLEGNM